MEDGKYLFHAEHLASHRLLFLFREKEEIISTR
jgi:hypothetical protein